MHEAPGPPENAAGAPPLPDARRPRRGAGPSLPVAAGTRGHGRGGSGAARSVSAALTLFGRLRRRPDAAHRRAAGPPPAVAFGPARPGRASPVNLTHSPFDAGPPSLPGHRAPRLWRPSPAPRVCRRFGSPRPAVLLSLVPRGGPEIRENPDSAAAPRRGGARASRARVAGGPRRAGRWPTRRGAAPTRAPRRWRCASRPTLSRCGRRRANGGSGPRRLPGRPRHGLPGPHGGGGGGPGLVS